MGINTATDCSTKMAFFLQETYLSQRITCFSIKTQSCKLRSQHFSLCSSALLLLYAFTSVLCSPVAIDARSILPLTVNTIHQFDIPSWNENLVVRKNGQLLVTRLDTPLLLQVDPKKTVAPVIVATLPSTCAGLLGITETLDDIFYVVAAAPFDGSFVKISNSSSSSVFKVNMNTFKLNAHGTIISNATISKIADLPTAGFLNGMITLNAALGYVLIADAYNGVVFRLNVYTGKYTILIDDPKMKYLPGSITNLGINGIKIRDSYLYWSNSGNPIFCRILISPLGNPIGAAQIIATVNNVDDFVFRTDGTA